MVGHEPASFILKATARCNLNCPYCYMFNLRDRSFAGRPPVMPREVVVAAAGRIAAQVRRLGRTKASVTFHGGEPLLAGPAWFRDAVAALRGAAPEVAFEFTVQSNGVLLTGEWLDLFADLGVVVALSVDGLPEVHNRTRVDHAGRGTYEATRRALERLNAHPAREQLFGGVLCVIDPSVSGAATYHHLRALGVDRMDFLLPLDHNWDAPPPRPGAYAEYLLPIFDAWWAENNPQVLVRMLFDIMKLLVGARQHIDSLGGAPVNIAVVETDGSLEPLDALRACRDGLTLTGLNVLRHDLWALQDTPVYQAAVAGQQGLDAIMCGGCALREVCGGGYLPNRYSAERGFANPSVYCLDLQRVILHVAQHIDRALPPAPAAGAPPVAWA
ncbi:radical SAM protein [Deinococcus multiflagellatus]|uniref:radical SAM protein n=1 Tax=Deinococcus multiflagellatus TaxID=1656887 RepID=UPI001CCD177D|nr:radical SAM protein [Deinococcus multiflagellatus]MBZ9712287.1 radical SAM protein [Deinococcus multiflagellatus]